MDWFVMRHPDIAVPGVVPESAVEHHRGRGWLRVSEALSDDERDQVVPGSYVDAPDLDAPKAEPAAKASAKTSTKEN